MKLIGLELRVGYDGGGYQLAEAKLFPAEIVIPEVGPYPYPCAEVTFHTSHGDVTVRTRLPCYGDRSAMQARDEREGVKAIASQLEGL